MDNEYKVVIGGRNAGKRHYLSIEGMDIVNKLTQLYTDPAPKAMKVAMAKCLYDEMIRIRKEHEKHEQKKTV